MARRNPATKLPALVTWLHTGAAIVAYSAHEVDGARLPYTAIMAARYEQRTGQPLTDCKTLKEAS